MTTRGNDRRADSATRPSGPDPWLAGRLVSDDGGVHVADADTGNVSAEEAGVHFVRPSGPPRDPRGAAARLELVEAEVDVLLRAVATLVESVRLLLEAEEGRPTEEAGEHRARVALAAREAHRLLVAFGTTLPGAAWTRG